jgi:hypothetical protein
MASDNKVSSFFLLILIGLAIYYLLNREGFSSIGKLTNYLQEDFADEATAEEEQNVGEEVVGEEVVEEEVPEVVEEEVVEEVPEIKYEVSQEPYVPQSVINDVAVGQTQPIDTLEQPTVTQPPMTVGVYNFQPNDESDLGVIGSSLNDAFALPVPNGVQTDAVDFKKQNVDNYNARDFLPREVNDEWFETDFSLAKYQLNDDKLINTERYIIGINTVGQSLKNASWDIRGTIPNPRFAVSPWGNSTYEPDFNLKPLC